MGVIETFQFTGRHSVSYGEDAPQRVICLKEKESGDLFSSRFVVNDALGKIARHKSTLAVGVVLSLLFAA